MSLRFIPENGNQSNVTSIGVMGGAPSAQGVYDTLREGATNPIATQVNRSHPLQTRLAKWEETQLEFKMENYRRVFGAAEPIRRTMELELVKESSKLGSVLGGSGKSIHQDILENADTTIDWETVYPSETNITDIHGELEKRLRV